MAVLHASRPRAILHTWARVAIRDAMKSHRRLRLSLSRRARVEEWRLPAQALRVAAGTLDSEIREWLSERAMVLCEVQTLPRRGLPEGANCRRIRRRLRLPAPGFCPR